jgi:hypothetical protein
VATKRSWHWTDEPVGDKRRRTVRNWCNYQDPQGVWNPTDLRIRRAEEGETFLGRSLEWVADRAPMQWFVGNSTEAGGRPWFGLRKSDDEEKGIVSFLLYGDASGGYTVDGPSKSALWDDVLPDTDMTLYAVDSRIERWISLLTPTAGEGGTGDRVTLGFVRTTLS